MEFVGPQVGHELQLQAIYAVLAGVVGMLVYIAARFDLKGGVAAIVAVFHDVLICLGALSLARLEFSLPVLAALLTIIGYSVNDTIVAYDRLRENRGRGGQRGKTFAVQMNEAVNQTLSRTVLTALTTFYLAGDVTPLLAAPLSYRRLHHARFVETLVSSSWMVLLVGLPALLAYGLGYQAAPLFYPVALGVLGAFLVIPAAIGVLVTTGLVLVFPARGTRDALLVGAGVIMAGLVVMVRLLQPERLVALHWPDLDDATRERLDVRARFRDDADLRELRLRQLLHRVLGGEALHLLADLGGARVLARGEMAAVLREGRQRGREEERGHQRADPAIAARPAATAPPAQRLPRASPHW